MPAETVLCYDCDHNIAALEVRKRHLCQECFQKYVASKILKRMETYRFKNQTLGGANEVNQARKKRLLLPVSGGVSSLVLLEVLDKQIKKQLAQQGRTAYDLVVCHILLEDAQDLAIDATAWYRALQKKVGEGHHFLPVTCLSEVFECDSRMQADLKLFGLVRSDGEQALDFLRRVIGSARTATARSDISTVLLRRMLVAMAKDQECTSILWGHSNSTLAALTLSSVAKGRGGAVSSEFSDGPSPWPDLNFNFPLRDLFETELQMYVDSLPDLRNCLAPISAREAPVSLRATSIDSLMSTYITGQGEKYPSIMANVVKTAGKLQTPKHEGFRCRSCAAPISGPGEVLCYGCERMKQDIRS